MKPSQLISRANIDDAYDEIHADMDFAYKRAKVLADMLEIPVHEHPEVTGTILGLVRWKVERLSEQNAEMQRDLTFLAKWLMESHRMRVSEGRVYNMTLGDCRCDSCKVAKRVLQLESV